MFFTKDFVLDELERTRQLVEEVLIGSTSKIEAEKLYRTLFKLDVVRNAVKNVHTNKCVKIIKRTNLHPTPCLMSHLEFIYMTYKSNYMD